MAYFGKLLWFGFAATMAAVWPAAVEGQSLSYLKTLPAGPPPWSAAAAAGDASGIYIAEGDTFLRKYDREGAEIWSRRFDAHIRSMATHDAGVYVGGLTSNVLPGQQRVGTTDAFVRLYDVDGNEKWTRQFGCCTGVGTYSYVRAIAADPSGVYAAGSDNRGGYLRKYDTRGAELWTKQFEATMRQSLSVLAAGPTGIYAGGQDGINLFIRRYDTNGAEIWTRPIDGTSLTGMSANATGVYATGLGEYGSFLSGYDSSGNQIWTRAEIGGWAQRIAVDADGIYVAGSELRALAGQCAAGSSDAFVKRFDADGAELWTRQFGSYNSEDVAGIVVDASSIFVAGSQFVGSVQFPARLVDRAFLAKLEKASVAGSPSETRIRNECVVNAASDVGGAVSPGEIVTIFGTAIGPSQPTPATISEDRPVGATLAETRVLFSGVAAPLLNVSSGQITAIVPNAVAGRSSVGVQVEYRGVLSNAVSLPVLKAHPGIFNLDGSGWGAVRNEDGALNSPANPAQRGSTVVIFGTGGGPTDPAMADGQIVGDPPPRLKTPVTVDFPETECTADYVPAAEASYAGAVAGIVAGLVQVNVRVPESLPAGIWSLHLGFAGQETETQSLKIAIR